MHGFDSLDPDDTLTKSLFHKLLVAFYAPARWPDGVVALMGAGVAAAAAALWGLAAGDRLLAAIVGVILMAFFAADIYILRLLPRRRVSFGPWKGQFLALALPRAGAALVAGLAGPWLGWTAALLLTVATQFLATAALYRAALVEPQRLAMSRVSVATDRLSRSAPPIRILHISDLHLERPGTREERLLELAREAQPDLILLTGDYVNLSYNLDAATHAALGNLLGRLRARYGVFGVLGSPPVDLRAAIPQLFKGSPVRLLRNEVIEVTLSRNRRVTLLGLDCHHDIGRDRATLAELAATVTGNGPRVLLYHSPELMPDASALGIDLYLCGHTHGGQVRLPGIGAVVTASKLGRRFVMGQYHEGRNHLYVSRGVGFEGLSAPRVRLFCPPEVTLVELGGEP